jgi:hypothetical protein
MKVLEVADMGAALQVLPRSRRAENRRETPQEADDRR